MGKKKTFIIIFALVFFWFLFSTSFLFAQERKLEIKYPEIFGLKPETVATGLAEYAKYIFNFSVAIIGLILFGVLIRAGILYLTSAGQPAKLNEAKERIISVFLGVILLLSGYLILTTINPQLVIFEFPAIKKAEICEKNEDCPRGFECKEGKCLVRTTCNVNEDCPYTYECKEGKCLKIAEVATQIFWEIPVGQMLEEGLWQKERTNNLKALLISFEQFLKQEIKTGGPSFNRISDLNKYLKNLTESCHCEELTGICQKAKNFAFPVGCSGDPCQEVRKEINNVLKINGEKSKELSAYKEKLVEAKNFFEEEGRKFRNLTEDIFERCKQRGLLTRAEYYESVASIEEQGGTTQLERLYLPAKEDDPLVFYCARGGTIFDYPYTPKQIPFEELKRVEEFAPEPETVKTGEPLSCPAVIPIGELIGPISALSYESNSNLEDLIYYIDKMLAELTKMTESVSQCNESRCDISCSCIPNPCFGICAPFPNPCFPFCKSPCLQALGGCYGEPCPRQKIAETVERIKVYEEEILNLLTSTQAAIEEAQLLLKTKEKDKIDLDMMRAAFQTCLNYGARTTVTEKPEEKPFWMLLRCEMALGNKGPDGNIITDCHPQTFFCCSNKPTAGEIKQFPSVLRQERPAVYTPLPEGPYSPEPSPSYGYNKVPYFSQYDEKWRNKYFGCGKTIGNAGCGPTSIAMALNFFGEKTDPPSVADWVLKNGYRVCGAGTTSQACCKAVETLGKEEGLKCKEFHGNVKAVLDELRNGKDKVAVISGRGAPPYTKGGHYIVLTGIEKEEGNLEFVYYNDPAYDPERQKIRPPRGKKPIDWFEKMGIRAGCVIYK